jgi:hypothetical protein
MRMIKTLPSSQEGTKGEVSSILPSGERCLSEHCLKGFALEESPPWNSPLLSGGDKRGGFNERKPHPALP